MSECYKRLSRKKVTFLLKLPLHVQMVSILLVFRLQLMVNGQSRDASKSMKECSFTIYAPGPVSARAI
jgi:hypothetical protein